MYFGNNYDRNLTFPVYSPDSGILRYQLHAYYNPHSRSGEIGVGRVL